jgi:hypothetical protein
VHVLSAALRLTEILKRRSSADADESSRRSLYAATKGLSTGSTLLTSSQGAEAAVLAHVNPLSSTRCSAAGKITPELDVRTLQDQLRGVVLPIRVVLSSSSPRLRSRSVAACFRGC